MAETENGSIIFNEIVDQLVPDAQAETIWDSGINTMPSTNPKLLLLGAKLATGTLADGQVRPITSLSKAIALWGKGSRLACMAEKALRAAPKAPIYGVSYPESAGVQATANVVISGTATGPGALWIRIGNRMVVVSISKTDTATEVGDGLEAAANALPNAPFTGDNTAGTVAMTARNKGAEGNSIRMHGECSAPGITVTIPEVLSSGTLAGDPTTVLAGLEGARYHLICLDTDDAAAIAAVKAHQTKQSTPSVKKWGMGLLSSCGALSASETLANTPNSIRMQLAPLYKSEVPVWELAASFSGLRARIADPRKGLDDEVVPDVPPPIDETAWPNTAEEELALKNGVTVLRPNKDGTVTVVRSVTTRSTAPVPFYDHNFTEISDYDDEYTLAFLTSRIKKKLLRTLGESQGQNEVTLKKAKSYLLEAMYALERQSYIQGTEIYDKAGKIIARPNAQNPHRIDFGRPFHPIPLVHFLAEQKIFTI